LKKWDDLKLKVNIVDNDEKLEKLFKNIKNFPQITLDTEATSINIIKAELV